MLLKNRRTEFVRFPIWAVDTGGGWSGKLTIMDIDSYEYRQSDLVPDLYPHIQGRRTTQARQVYF